MEDAHAIVPSGDATFFGVFDGHGGSAVSAKLKSELYAAVDSKRRAGASVEAALRGGLLAVDQASTGHCTVSRIHGSALWHVKAWLKLRTSLHGLGVSFRGGTR